MTAIIGGLHFNCSIRLILRPSMSVYSCHFLWLPRPCLWSGAAIPMRARQVSGPVPFCLVWLRPAFLRCKKCWGPLFLLFARLLSWWPIYLWLLVFRAFNGLKTMPWIFAFFPVVYLLLAVTWPWLYNDPNHNALTQSVFVMGGCVYQCICGL